VKFLWFQKSIDIALYWFKKIIYSGKKKSTNQVDIIEQHDQKLVLQLSPSRLPKLNQLKYLHRFLNKKEKKQTYFFLIIACITLLISLFSYGWRQTTIYPKNGGSYTEALIGTPQYINPIFAIGNDVDQDLVRLIFSGLMQYNENLELVPDLAESYDISSDQKVYTFRLKPNLTWQDGKELTARDVAFTYSIIQDTKNNSPLESSFRGIKITQLDDQTVQFVLDKPFAPFLNSLTVGIIPEHAWKNSTKNFKLAELNLKPIGSGAWKFESLKKNKEGGLISYSLTPFADYYGNKPYLQNLFFKFYPDHNTAFQALQEQNVDGLSYLPKEKKTTTDKIRNIKVYNLQLPQYTGIFINENNNDILKELKIRTALGLAIDKNKIVNEIFQNEALSLAGPILPGLPGFNSELPTNSYNKQSAEELLDKLGWKYNEGASIRNKDNKNLELTLTTVDFQDNIIIAELIRQAWEQIGIKTNLNIIPTNSIQKDIIKPRNYELLLFGEILGSNPDFYPFWHSSQIKDPGLNLTTFNNKLADSLLEQARQTSDITKKTELYSQFQKIILENQPAIFLFQPTYSYPMNEKIKGQNINRINTPSDRFNAIESWYIKTKRRFIK
jgi:peptide/nickel transport system substrate-binding protein